MNYNDFISNKAFVLESCNFSEFDQMSFDDLGGDGND